MGDYYYFLISILHKDMILKCALKVHKSRLPDHCAIYPMESESKALFHGLLSENVRRVGPVVDVEELFWVEALGPEKPGETY